MQIHLKAPRGWINDPNGFIFYKGMYHLFYQHFPYAPQWGRMHWGHAVSRDLLNWEHLDIALFPTKSDDRDGCFSGSAIEHDGRLYLYYTGVRYGEADPENVNVSLNDNFIAAQMMITSEDGFSFDNFHCKKTIIPPIENLTLGDKKHTRDPKVWLGKDGNYYMVLGSVVNQEGRLLFYRSANLKDWIYVNCAECTEPENDYGWMWECPDYFEIDNRGVLIFSPLDTSKGSQSMCLFTSFEEESCTMNIGTEFRYLDYGFELYAPQSTTDKDGNRVVIAWLRMPKPMADNTIGLFCIPRICEVKDGHIYFRPHDNIRNKFTRKSNELRECCRINADLKEGDRLCIGGYVVGRKNNRVYTDRTRVIPENAEVETCFEIPEIGEDISVEIYVDAYIIEIYVNDGQYVITNAVYGLSDVLEKSMNGEVEITVIED